MEESPKVYGTFYGLLINQNTEVVHTKFFNFSVRRRTPLEKFFKSYFKNGMTPPIFQLLSVPLRGARLLLRILLSVKAECLSFNEMDFALTMAIPSVKNFFVGS